MDDVARSAGVTRLIVYRIFTSKEELYRAVLEQVTTRLGEEFDAIVGDEPTTSDVGRGRAASRGHRTAGEAGRGHAAAALLRVAREDPDAFRLLWLHAAHEPPFAAYHREFRTVADAMAADLIRPYLADPTLRAWAAPHARRPPLRRGHRVARSGPPRAGRGLRGRHVPRGTGAGRGLGRRRRLRTAGGRPAHHELEPPRGGQAPARRGRRDPAGARARRPRPAGGPPGPGPPHRRAARLAPAGVGAEAQPLLAGVVAGRGAGPALPPPPRGAPARRPHAGDQPPHVPAPHPPPGRGRCSTDEQRVLVIDAHLSSGDDDELRVRQGRTTSSRSSRTRCRPCSSATSTPRPGPGRSTRWSTAASSTRGRRRRQRASPASRPRPTPRAAGSTT